MGYVLNITGPKGLMCWCAENQMKWQCSEPTEHNENIVFWINWNGGEFVKDAGQAGAPCCALSTVLGDLFQTSVTVLPPLWLGTENQALFIYLLLFTQAGRAERAMAASQKRPASPIFSCTHSHLWEPGFPHCWSTCVSTWPAGC